MKWLNTTGEAGRDTELARAYGFTVKTAEEAGQKTGKAMKIASVIFCTGGAGTGFSINCWASMGGQTIITADGRVYNSGQGGIRIL